MRSKIALSSATLSYGKRYLTRRANIDDAAHRHRLWSIRDSMLLHYLRFFRDARRRKKALAATRLAMAALPTLGTVLATACSPPTAQPGVAGVIDVGTVRAREFLRSGWATRDEKLDSRTVRWAPAEVRAIRVSVTDPQGWYAQAGFQDGDLVVGIDGDDFRNKRHLYALWAGVWAKDRTVFHVLRDGRRLDLELDGQEFEKHYREGGHMEFTAR